MTDYFALLGEPRRPWIEPEELKQKYHRLTLAAHPDTRGDAVPNDAFAELSKGYQILSDPTQRVLHLLTLEGQPRTANARTAPTDLADLFLDVGALNQRIDLLCKKHSEANSNLGKSMLTGELLDLHMQLREQLDRLHEIYNDQLDQLKGLNESWTSDRIGTMSRVAEIHGRITYLSRWIAQLEEKRVQLSLAS